MSIKLATVRNPYTGILTPYRSTEGANLTHAAFDKTSLMAWWTLDETTGNRADSHGSNDLVPAGTVSFATGKKGNAISFAGAGRATIADNTDLSTGDIDFALGLWVYPTTLAASQFYISKWETAVASLEYLVWYNISSARFSFSVYTGAAAATASATTLGAPSINTWYFIMAWHDSVGNTVNIQVNDGTVDNTAHSGGVQDTATALSLGASPGGGSPVSAREDEAFFMKRIPTSLERTWMYNAGAGRTYSGL